MEGVKQGPETYALTDAGINFLSRWKEGRAVED
jgi:hypothetical protein